MVTAWCESVLFFIIILASAVVGMTNPRRFIAHEAAVKNW